MLGLIFHRYAVTMVENVMARPLLETGRGLIILIVLPVVSIMLLVSLIGIPLGILGIISFAALMIVASAFAAILAGSVVHKWLFKPADYKVAWQTILLGALVVTILGFIPFVGGLAKFLLILASLGAAVKLKWDAAKEWR